MNPTRLLAPDMALVGAAVTLVFCIFLYDGPQKLFRDSDTGWHIRTGERILAEGRLPRVDPYSFTKAGEPWVAWEWGADVLMGWVHQRDGLKGVALLYMAAISACTWLWFRLNWAAGGDFLLACAMASPMLSTVNMHWLARPHIFGWVFLLIAMLAFERRLLGFRWWHGVLAFAGGALWANVHASFFLLPLLALLYAVGDRWSRSWFLWIAVASAAGTFVNPYGWRLHQHLFAYLSNQDLLSRVGEFQSFNFFNAGSLQILAMLWTGALGMGLAAAQRNWAHVLLGSFGLLLGVRSARGLPLAALVVLPLANGAILKFLNNFPQFDTFRHFSTGLRKIDDRFRGWAWMPALLSLGFLMPQPGFPKDQFPVAASEQVAKLRIRTQILAPDKYGGYLIYRFNGERKVYFDGRSDFYGLAFMQDYIKLMQVRPGWQQQVDRWGFTHALLPNDYSLVAALEAAGWKRSYQDGTATLMER